ncbi:hypothetical protein D3C72_1667210 [compost metagenome]
MWHFITDPFDPAIELTGWGMRRYGRHTHGRSSRLVCCCVCVFYYFKGDGVTLCGIGHAYGRSVICCSNSFRQACNSDASWNTFAAVAPITFPASSMPLCAIEVRPCATSCQVCSGVPTVKHGLKHCATGIFQLTSPTSVDPASTLSVMA